MPLLCVDDAAVRSLELFDGLDRLQFFCWYHGPASSCSAVKDRTGRCCRTQSHRWSRDRDPRPSRPRSPLSTPRLPALDDLCSSASPPASTMATRPRVYAQLPRKGKMPSRFEHHLQRARLAAVEKAIGFGPFRQSHAVADLPLGMQATGANERDEFGHVTLD